MENTKELLNLYMSKTKLNDELLFSNATYELIRYLFKKINVIIDNKNVTPHTFRRTRATHLLDKGVSIVYIKELLGHSNIITTEKYAKVITKSKFKAIEENSISSIKNDNLIDWNDDQDLLNQLLNL